MINAFQNIKKANQYFDLNKVFVLSYNMIWKTKNNLGFYKEIKINRRNGIVGEI